MSKTHLKITGADCRKMGQTQHEYDHQTACGYVRTKVTRKENDVDCFHCRNSIHMVKYHAVNKTKSESHGFY